MIALALAVSACNFARVTSLSAGGAVADVADTPDVGDPVDSESKIYAVGALSDAEIPAHWGVAANCRETGGSQTVHVHPVLETGAFRNGIVPYDVVYERGVISDFVNRKGLLLDLSRDDKAFSRVVLRDLKFFDIKRDLAFTNGCGVHADAIYIRNGQTSSGELVNLLIDRVEIRRMGGAIMTIQIENPRLGIFHIRDSVFLENAHIPLSFRLNSATSGINLLKIENSDFGGRNSDFANVLPGKLKRVVIINSPGVPAAGFCKATREVYVASSSADPGRRVCP